MKKIFILFTTLLISLYTTFSQTSFELTLNRDNAQRNMCIIEDYTGNYIIGSTEFTANNYYPVITKLSSLGEIIDTVFFYNNTLSIIDDIIKIKDNEYFVIGASYSSNISDCIIWSFKMDNNLNIKENRKIDVNKNILRLKAKLNYDGDIILFGGFNNETSSNQAFIYKIDTSSNILNTLFLGSLNYSCIFDIIQKKDTTGYKLFLLDFGDRAIEIDNNFNIINSHFNIATYIDGSAMMPNSNNCFWISDTSYVITGIKLNDKKDISLIISDTFNNPVYDFAYQTNSNDMVAFWDNISFINSKNIYFLGTLNYSFNPFETSPNELILFNFNDTLGLNWQKTFGGDAYYNATNIIATQDGGCLIAGTRSDSSNYHDYDMYFLKLDSLGTLTHINGKPVDVVSDFAVYPTPATDFINIKKSIQITQADFVLYNSLGQKVLQHSLNQDITTLNISNLQKGIYVYNIIINSKIVDTGKTIIE